ncbi:hypothetical protein K491DRAFT_690339 [Lophiostoma macrostomum CBS 122681]|uniref:Uncharacterized protein n=1 Tax=Lophiostoma macrostomum CBS 122681 TaxID=1314788 RepID=A0A6A6TDV9_9PLEO|nr:hypothetical protein K491DRAFT_690339 [Lophiostoma macrostomum CBS 122681]
MADTQCITELQEAFGTLLLHRYRRSKSPRKHQWTGCFRLFDFPRELRDRIYYYYLYVPEGLVHSRNSSRARRWPFEDSSHVSLFLTSHQVYEEARLVFYRYNAIEIPYKWQLAGILRLFPEKPAALLQRIQLCYFFHTGKRDWKTAGLGGVWAQIVDDARLAKEYFPLLRQCIAFWSISVHSFQNPECQGGANLALQGKSDDERVGVFFNWLMWRCEVDKVAPPKWLLVDFSRYYKSIRPVSTTEGLQRPFEEALGRVKQQSRGKGSEQDDSELTGKKWLEEMSSASSKGEKRRRRREIARLTHVN